MNITYHLYVLLYFISICNPVKFLSLHVKNLNGTNTSLLCCFNCLHVLETNMIIDATKLDAVQKREVEITPVTDVELKALRRKLDDVNKRRNIYQQQLDSNKTKMSKINKHIKPEKAEILQNYIDNLNRKLENLNDKQKEYELELITLEEKKQNAL